MNQQIEWVPNPEPLSPSGGPPGVSLAELVEALADLLIEAGPAVRKWEELAAGGRQRVLQLQRLMESITARHHDQLQQTAQHLAAFEQTLSTVSRETAKCAEQTTRLNQCCEALTFNLEQIRLLGEALVEKQQALADQFIERHVTDHLFKEFLNIQFALTRYSASGNGNLKADIQAVAEAIESFLAESGLRVINPPPGAAFEPREHQPVKVVPTGELDAEGTVAETFTPGLSRGHRVIQQARVAVFKVDGVKNAR